MPDLQPIPTPRPPQQVPSNQTSTGKKVLIIEDDVFIRDLYEMQAKKMGYEVITADNGEQGIAKAKAQPPDLLLTDLMLPKIDGISIVRAFKSDPNLSKVPCIIVTNLEDATKEKEALEAGAASYILKIKNTPSKVVETFKTYLNNDQTVSQPSVPPVNAAPVPTSNQAPIQTSSTSQPTPIQNQNSAPVDFVSLVAHELKTPLTSLRGYLSVFIEENGKSMTPEQNMFLSRIDIASTQLSSLVENLLNTSRIERGVISLNIEQVDWVPFVKTLFIEFENRAKERKIELQFVEPTTPIPPLNVDKLRITEVISNLIANAITYNKEGGKLILSMELKGNEVITHVQDTGIGIAKEAQGKLFEKYYRVQNSSAGRANGTGLGLYVSKIFVEMHKGKIWVESEPDQGSTFSFSLPVANSLEGVQK